ncbi:hypothetical protein GTS_42630 [Gandjariella thermophila]|uniref:Uncharacterized protein n=1 Tax=Gandjariella thermophila TaxID=1931992 RepID=A0A4D4JC97_9PSEU|nr:hypothetical protein GTS_42630 [Gandjariella thermophila]
MAGGLVDRADVTVHQFLGVVGFAELPLADLRTQVIGHRIAERVDRVRRLVQPDGVQPVADKMCRTVGGLAYEALAGVNRVFQAVPDTVDDISETHQCLSPCCVGAGPNISSSAWLIASR